MPETGYQYKKSKTNIHTGEVEVKIASILANFGYVQQPPWKRQRKSQTIYFIRSCDEIDRKIGVPKKFVGHERFGVIVITYYFWDELDTIPRRISIRPSDGWEFIFSGCDRALLAMEKIEKILISDGHYKIIYKYIDEINGFQTEAEEKRPRRILWPHLSALDLQVNSKKRR